jgi:hypothetical protein
MVLILGLSLVLLLGATLEVRRTPLVSALTTWSARPTRGAYVLGVIAVLAANIPLVLWAAAFSGRGAGDARTHAMLANVIAKGRLPHGWTDAYAAGFAVGPHYPVVGWGLSALFVKVGFAPMVAVNIVAFAAIVGAPLAAFVLALRARAMPFTAVACALFLSWVSPDGYFVGGGEAFYGQGLLSQVVVIPSLVFFVAAIARAGSPWKATLSGVVAVACHPQIAVACVAVLFLPVLASRDRGAIGRYIRASLAMGLVGAAVYGPGIATLKVPFGWPPMESWKTIGFGTHRLEPWLLEGELLDKGRGPVLTALWGVSILLVLFRLRRPAPRAAAIASLVCVTLSVSGSALQGLGAVGAFLLSFLQPLRVLGVVPLVASGTVLIAVEEAAPLASELYERVVARFPPPFASALAPRVLQGVVLIVVAWAALPERFAVADSVHQKIEGILESFGPDDACGPRASPTFPARAVKTWVSSLVSGRLWYDDPSPASLECEFASGFEIDSSVPIAVTSGVGGHVGVHHVAFHQLAPGRPGSALRAEALGIRHALLFTKEPLPDGWETVHRSGDVVLARRVGGTDIVGVGCITSLWLGSDVALRERLIADLATKRGARALLDPNTLVALETVSAEWAERSVATGDCSVDGASVEEHPREPGAQEADVDLPSPVDVVIRVAAFPTWRVLVDGRPTPTTMVAPGYPSVRVPAGKHHIEAVVSPLPSYLQGISLALVGAVLCAVVRSKPRRV